MKYVIQFVIVVILVLIMSNFPLVSYTGPFVNWLFVYLLLLLLLNLDVLPSLIFTVILLALVSFKGVLLIALSYCLPLLLFSILKKQCYKYPLWLIPISALALILFEFLNASLDIGVKNVSILSLYNALLEAAVLGLFYGLTRMFSRRSLKVRAL